ncbi:MAG: hypothetical protein AAFO04_16820 [Cyanobacteria bacterium J06592_8]
MNTYAGFAFSLQMKTTKVALFKVTTIESNPENWELIKNSIPVFNKGHIATIKAIKTRFYVDLSIPETPPSITLNADDIIYVIQVKGLARLVDRKEYTNEEIANASFSIEKVEVLEAEN